MALKPHKYHRKLNELLNIDAEQIVVCAEFTGLYIYPLTISCQAGNYKLWLEDPTQIKYSSGLQRGKNDPVDAKRIALYAYRYIDKLKIYNHPTINSSLIFYISL